MKRFAILVLFPLFLLNCERNEPSNSHKLIGPFMSMNPNEEAKILAPNIISTSLEEYNGTFSPKGDEFFYTSVVAGKGIICHSYLQDDNSWTEMEVASFSGIYSEYDPLFSPDGKRLYFSSERPVDSLMTAGETNIWYVEKEEDKWSEPKFVALEGNGDYFSSLTSSGDIYYNVWNNGNIYKAQKTENGFESVLLPEIINGGSDVGDPFISPDENYLIFRGYDNSMGRGDLYISYNLNGTWTEAKNLGSPINSSSHEMCPYVTTDGKIFIFASSRLNEDFNYKNLDGMRKKFSNFDNGMMNIYYCSTEFIDRLRPVQ